MSNVVPTNAAGHATTADTLPSTIGPGGMWSVSCACGWTMTGEYARTNEIAEYVALRLANAFGAQHQREVSP